MSKIKAYTIEQVKQPLDLKFAKQADGEGVDCTILSQTLKGIFDSTIQNYTDAKQLYHAHCKEVGYDEVLFKSQHEQADTKGKRALTKLKKSVEDSSQYEAYVDAQNDEYSIKKKITDEYYKCIKRHHAELANELFVNFAHKDHVIDVTKFVNDENEWDDQVYEVTLEDSPLEELAEADKLLKQKFDKGLFLRIEFEYGTRRTIKQIKLHNGENVYYSFHMESINSEKDFDAIIRSEVTGFYLDELIKTKGICQVSAHLKALSLITNVLLGIETTFNELACKQVYKRAKRYQFKVVNATAS
jgi:hypothetical protein